MRKFGQITIEYLLLFVVIVLVVILAANGKIPKQIGGLFDGMGEKIGAIAK